MHSVVSVRFVVIYKSYMDGCPNGLNKLYISFHVIT